MVEGRKEGERTGGNGARKEERKRGEGVEKWTEVEMKGSAGGGNDE